MPDTFKSWSDLTSDFADNSTANITPAQLRTGFNSFRAWGQFYTTGGSSAVNVATAGTYVDLTGLSAAADELGVTLASTAPYTFTPTADGVYQVSFNLTAVVGNVAAGAFTFRAYKNTSTSIPGAIVKKIWGTATDNEPVSFSVPVALTSSDTVKIMLTCADTTASRTITPSEVNFSIHRIA